MITPINEQGVVTLFQELSKSLGYEVVFIQAAFPDAIIKDKSGNEFKIEFEYKSRNFYNHKHDPAGCDAIICWEDNYPGCPIPVISLKQYLDNMKLVKMRRNRILLAYFGLLVMLIQFGIFIYLLINDDVFPSSIRIVTNTTVAIYILLWVAVLFERAFIQRKS